MTGGKSRELEASVRRVETDRMHLGRAYGSSTCPACDRNAVDGFYRFLVIGGGFLSVCAQCRNAAVREAHDASESSEGPPARLTFWVRNDVEQNRPVGEVDEPHVPRPKSAKRRGREKPKPSVVTIWSHECRKLGRRGECGFCHAGNRILWRYAKTDVGTVALCSECRRAAIKPAAPPKRDAMNRALRGGAWEQNRRRH